MDALEGAAPVTGDALRQLAAQASLHGFECAHEHRWYMRPGALPRGCPVCNTSTFKGIPDFAPAVLLADAMDALTWAFNWIGIDWEPDASYPDEPPTVGKAREVVARFAEIEARAKGEADG